MEKLSSILATSPRVQSVDTSDTPPARPGAPTFGRPAGGATIRDRFSVSQDAKDLAFKETLAGTNPKESASSKVVTDMTKKFFENRVAEVKPVASSEELQERQIEEEEPSAQKSTVPTPVLQAPRPQPAQRIHYEA